MTAKIITPADITRACEYLDDRASQYMPTRPFPTTQKRHDAALLAAGRDALARVLMMQHGIKSYGTLTKAIRAGHQGDATDFAAINKAGARALGLTFGA